MGSCYAIPIILPYPQQIQIENENRNCIICLEKVVSHNIYVKCSKCHSFLHTLCAFEYKIKQPDVAILCPDCKCKNALFIYNNDVCNCELL